MGNHKGNGGSEMMLDLLLTEEIKATMPETVKILHNCGKVTAIFEALDPTKDEPEYIEGESVIVEADKQEIINWLKPFDGVPVGCGSPQLEHFTIRSIKDNL